MHSAARSLLFLEAIARVTALCSTTSGAFQKLFSDSDFTMRNACSRKDGYWPYVAQKEEPPLELVYGEFPLDFFSRVVDRACEAAGITDCADATFCDVGSGCGRLVLWAAATGTWKQVHGVELLPSLHATALEKREEAAALHATGELPLLTPSACISLHAGSWDDGALFEWDDVDVCFAYTTAFGHDEAGVLVDLNAALQKRLRRGSIVCTTDYRLGDGFEELEQIEDANEGVGGTSVVYVHRKTCDGERAYDALAARRDELAARIHELEAELAERDVRLAELAAAHEELQREAGQEQADAADEVMAAEDLRAWAEEAGYMIP